MTRADLRDRIKNTLFLLDGAMGTQLIALGIEVGTSNDYLNIKSPDIITKIHKAYFRAGSDAVLTNTFGANKYALERHGHSDKVTEINCKGAQIARKAAGNGKYVIGDIGPCGDFLEPIGGLEPAALREAFAQQAKGLADGGVDGFIIETMSAIDEVKVAVEAVKTVSELPIFVSLAFDSTDGDFKTMMGVGVKDAVSQIIPTGIDAIGFNCGRASLDGYVTLAGRFVEAVKSCSNKVAVLAEPNAGLPQLEDGKAVYKISSEDFAQAAEKIYKAGVNIIGGCCGTGPDDIKYVADKLKSKK